ncbi:MAG: nuclear transport factor 2 family protein [Blastocatellia bacterium]
MFKKSILLSLLFLVSFASFASAQAEAARATDRAAIRAHIESIFQAFINKDGDKLRATHSEDWRGFLEGSPVAIRGIDEYMKAVGEGLKQADSGMSGYKITDFDVLFHGADLAVVCFVADVEFRGGGGSKLRILDVYARRNGHWIQAGSHTVVHPQAIARQIAAPVDLSAQARERILKAREAVWRAWFTNDRATLEKMIPEDAIAIDSGTEVWGTRASILDGAKRFAEGGARLVRLEFPRTDFQMYGRTIILYTTYRYELESNGQKSTFSGRGTEVFVIRDGEIVNTGWHLDAGK